MATASMETITRWTKMMAWGRCSVAEYQRMVAEKAKAAMETAVVLAKPGSAKRKSTGAKALAPLHRAVVANAKRLRKK